MLRAVARRAVLAASVLAGLTLTPAATAPAAELTPERAKEVARATTLVTADLPRWEALSQAHEGKQPDADDRRHARCLGLDADPAPVARFISPTFGQRRTLTIVGSTAAVSATSSDAARIAALAGTARARRCSAKSFRRGLAQEHVRHQHVTVRPLWVPGAAAGGMRIRISVAGVRFVVESRTMAVGPVVIELTVLSSLRPFPEERARALLAALRARGEAVLAAGAPTDPPVDTPAGAPAG